VRFGWIARPRRSETGLFLIVTKSFSYFSSNLLRERSFFLDKLHAAFGAIARFVLHDFGVHRAGILRLSAAVLLLGLAAGYAERGETERQCEQQG